MIEAKFYSPERPETIVAARISYPERSDGDDFWHCHAQLDGLPSPMKIELHSDSQITLLMLAFAWVRKSLEAQAETYLQDGELPLNYAIARTIPYSFGDDIIEKAERYIDELVGARVSEWHRKADDCRRGGSDA